MRVRALRLSRRIHLPRRWRSVRQTPYAGRGGRSPGREGSSVCRAFTTGYKFGLTDHYQAAMNATYVLVEIQHTASTGGSYSLAGGGERRQLLQPLHLYPRECSLPPRAPHSQALRAGAADRVVVGKSSGADDSSEDDGGDSEDIWVDKYGGSLSCFPGTAPASAPAGCAFRRSGPARVGARSPFLASDRKCSSAFLKATRTGRSSPDASITQTRPFPTPCLITKPAARSRPEAPQAAAQTTTTSFASKIRQGVNRSSCAEKRISIPG